MDTIYGGGGGDEVGVRLGCGGGAVGVKWRWGESEGVVGVRVTGVRFI